MHAIDDDVRRWDIVQGVSSMLMDFSMDDTPAYNSSLILHKVSDFLGVPDPFEAAKKELNQKALALTPLLIQKIKVASDRLEAAVRLTVAGNVMDLGIKHEASVEQAIEQALGDGFTRFDYDAFKAAVAKAKRILYILDNAGEIVFDKILIEGLRAQGKMTLAAVKGGPILNDATMADAQAIGLDKIVKVIDTGNNFVGVQRDKCSDFFLKVLDSADLVIAKGQGNYETLDESGERFFFLLKAKCPHVAQALGVKTDDMVLAQG
jgi:hypothetical protein